MADQTFEYEKSWWDDFTGYCRQATDSDLGQEAVEMADLSETIGYWLRQHPWSRGDNNAWILHVADLSDDLSMVDVSSFEFGSAFDQLEIYRHSYRMQDIFSLLVFINTNNSEDKSAQTELGFYVPNDEDRQQFVKYGSMIMESNSTSIQNEGTS